MTEFFTSLVVFAILYYPLRLLNENWERLSLPSWWVIPAGIVSWCTVFSLLGIVYTIGLACAQVVKTPNIEAAAQAVGIFFLVGIIANLVSVHREILEWDRMKPFIKDSMRFINYFGSQEDLFVQLEKKQIRDIHREITGKELVDGKPAKKVIVHTDPAEAQRMLEETRRQSIESVHWADELAHLEAGDTVTISDTFTINSFKHPTHSLYKDTQDVRIDATARVLTFAVRFAKITGEMPLTNDVVFHVKQDLYDELQAIITEQWLKPYTKFFEKISVTCFRVKLDSFDMPQQSPFMQVDILVSQLRARERRFFSVADLHTIATVTMME